MKTIPFSEADPTDYEPQEEPVSAETYQALVERLESIEAMLQDTRQSWTTTQENQLKATRETILETIKALAITEEAPSPQPANPPRKENPNRSDPTVQSVPITRKGNPNRKRRIL